MHILSVSGPFQVAIQVGLAREERELVGFFLFMEPGSFGQK